MYLPSKKPRNTCTLLECIHSAPALIVCRPLMIDRLSLNWNRCISSSTFGPRKNGLPKRNVVPKPIAVSAGTLESTAERGRDSREYVKWNSFSRFDDIVVNRLTLKTLILDGPSMPLAELP